MQTLIADFTRMKEAEDQVHHVNPDVKTRVLVLDLGSLTQVKQAAKEVLTYPEPIDVGGQVDECVPSVLTRLLSSAGPHQQRSHRALESRCC
jgi:hypothetical protein